MYLQKINLKNKYALVTGAGKGLGRACSIALAEAGATVIALSRTPSDLNKLEKDIKKVKGKIIKVSCDVMNYEDLKQKLDKIKIIDVLVNNAGTTKFANHQKLDALTDQDFIDIYKVNVVGPYQMIRAVEPYMKKQKFGSVVNVSSIAGKTGIGSSIAYAASKGALNTMTLSLAKALGPEIRVNTVCPGFIGTGWFLDRFGEETFNRIVKDQKDITPLKRAGTPDDIAKSVIFFCLEGGEHITGETLISDAGMHLSLPKQ